MKSAESATRTSDPGNDEYDDATEGLLHSQEKKVRWEQDPSWFSGNRAITIHACVFVFYLITTIGLGVALGRAWAKMSKEYLHSPANEAVEWSVQEFNSGNGLHGNFIGPPRPALEKAWGDLLKPMNLRLDREDIVAFNRQDEAVELTDGTGYAGTLNVYHELHCVRWLHKYVWQDEYWPGLDEEQKKKNKSHSEHCLNTLRKFAMCHGDVGMVIYSWQPGILKPGANGTAHQCVDWPRLSTWANDRAIDIYNPGLIVNPELGPVYVHGEEAKDLHEP